jgi:hypothetical protein
MGGATLFHFILELFRSAHEQQLGRCLDATEKGGGSDGNDQQLQTVYMYGFFVTVVLMISALASVLSLHLPWAADKVGPCLVPPILPKILLYTKKISRHIKISANAWSTKC